VKPPVVLAVGGIDTGNGAGVESDARAMASLGVHAVLAPYSVDDSNYLRNKEGSSGGTIYP